MNMHVRHPDEVLAPKAGGADHRFDTFRFLRAVDFLQPSRRSRQRWLDAGCHKGEFLNFLYTWGDFALQGCDKWTSQMLGPWGYRQVDLEHSFPDGVFDIISSLEVIEHLIDTDEFLHNCFTHLAPSGRLLLSTPNINSLRNRLLVPFGFYPYGLEHRNVIHHVRLYNPSALAAQLREVGFVNVRIRGVSFLPLRSRWGTGRLSQWLANHFPALCNNFMIVAQKGPKQ